MLSIVSNEMEKPAAHVTIRYSWHRLKLQDINVPSELAMND